jgi:threonine dehydratase
VLEGDDHEDARRLAGEIAETEDAYLVEDSLDLLTCDGAGTIGIGCVAKAIAPDDVPCPKSRQTRDLR